MTRVLFHKQYQSRFGVHTNSSEQLPSPLGIESLPPPWRKACKENAWQPMGWVCIDAFIEVVAFTFGKPGRNLRTRHVVLFPPVMLVYPWRGVPINHPKTILSDKKKPCGSSTLGNTSISTSAILTLLTMFWIWNPTRDASSTPQTYTVDAWFHILSSLGESHQLIKAFHLGSLGVQSRCEGSQKLLAADLDADPAAGWPRTIQAAPGIEMFFLHGPILQMWKKGKTYPDIFCKSRKMVFWKSKLMAQNPV